MYRLYATAEKGKGFVQEIGSFEDVEDIEIRVELFEKDVVITIEKDGYAKAEEKDEDEKEEQSTNQNAFINITLI